MNNQIKSVFLLALLLIAGTSWGQGFVLTSLNTTTTNYSDCDSTLSLSISPLYADSSMPAEINFALNGANFSASQFTSVVYWGDGSVTTHGGGTNSAGTAISWNPPLNHNYSGTGNFTVLVQVTNPMNNTSVLDTIFYTNGSCNTAYVFASTQLDCDNDGTTDSTINNGVPLIITSNFNTFFATTQNVQAVFNNIPSGTYTITVDPNWLVQNGYQVESIFGNVISVTQTVQTFTTAITLNCVNSQNTSCISGYVFCDQDTNMVLSMPDVLLLNVPITISVGGLTQTVYSSSSGYFQSTFNIPPGSPAVVMLNPNWLAVNGYSGLTGPQTILTSPCNNMDTTFLPVDCNNSCSQTACASVYVFCDANNNNVFDAGELPVIGAPVQFMTSSINTIATVYTDSSGYAEYCSNSFPNTYLFAQINNYWLQQHGYGNTTGLLTLLTSNNQTSTPGMYSLNCGSGNTCADLWTTVTPWIGYYQGQTNYIKLNIGNYGPGTASTYTVTMTFPSGVTPVTSSINLPGYSISGNTITWNLTNAYAGYSYSDIIYFTCPIGLPSGTAHYFTSTITATNNTTDCNTTNNAGNLLQLVGSSYDPNDKTVDLEENINPATTETLTYVIRFQNTGTAPAQNIYILDTLSANLDWTSFELLETSHPMQVINLGNGVLRFDYPQIWLPDSSANEPESHGHLVYRIREQSTNGLGTEIFNTAHIYFDWNDAIVTNTTYNVNTALSIEEISSDAVKVFPNPATDWLSIQTALDMQLVELVDVSGKVLISCSPQDAQTGFSLNGTKPGIYLLRIYTASGIVCKTVVKK